MAAKRVANSESDTSDYADSEQEVIDNRRLPLIHSHQKKRIPAKRRQCPNCSKSFLSLQFYWQHLRSHLQYHPFECDMCLECFSEKKLLLAHKETHSKSRLYECSRCPKSFPHVSALNRHCLSHLERKPFPCPICSEKFSTLPSRSRHVKNHIVSCALCRVDFQDFAQLMDHIASVHRSKTSEDDGPGYIVPIEPGKDADLEAGSSPDRLKERSIDFTCFVCEQGFASEESMKTHLKAHRLFICSHCPQFFANLFALRDHEFTHTGKHPFKCDACQAIFHSAKHLRCHQQTCKLGNLPSQGLNELSSIMDTINNAVDISSDVKAKVERAIKTVLSGSTVGRESCQSHATQSLLEQIDPHAVARLSLENSTISQNRQTLQKAMVLVASDLDRYSTPTVDFTNLFHCYWVIRLLDKVKPDSYPLQLDMFWKLHHINSSLVEQMGKGTTENAITKENLKFLNCIYKKLSFVLGCHFDSLVHKLS